MACAITAISSSTDCAANQGGIIYSFACKYSDITSVTITSNVISSFTMASTGLWKRFDYDLNNTANFNQVGALNGNRFTIEQTSFMSFRGITAAYILAANTASECCDTVWIHFLANGLAVVQGIEFLAATGAPNKSANRSTRIVPTINTDVALNEARVEYTVAGSSNTFGQTTSLNAAAIAAL